MDNESTDNTRINVNKITTIDKRVHFYCMKDKGIYDAMNNSIDLAQGELLYFMGADDKLHDKEVLSSINEACNQGTDIIYGNVIWKPSNYIEKGEWSLEKLLNININHQRIFYRKIIFEKYGNYDIRYKIAADCQLNIRFFCNEQIKKKHIDVLVADYDENGYSANRTDNVFWENWEKNVLDPFSKHLSSKKIYTSKSTYIYNLIKQKKYTKATRWTLNVFFHTFSFGFVLLMFRYAIQSRSKNAA